MIRPRRPRQLPRPAAVVEVRSARIEQVSDSGRIPFFVSVKSIAMRLGVSKMQVYRAYRAGRLPGFRVLGCLRFLEEDVLRLLREEGLSIGESK